MRIVGFAGRAGSGKDTSADFLVNNYGFIKVAFADKMKRICADVYPLMTREHLWGPSSKRNESIKEYPREHGPWVFGKCACCNAAFVEGTSKQCYLTSRFALQQLGTEWGRNNYVNTWTDPVMDAADKLLNKSGILRSVHYSYTPWDGIIVSNVPKGPRPRGVVISDLRWPAGNEGQTILGGGGYIYKLLRGEGLEGAAGQHDSERAMLGVPDSYYSGIIDNREWTLEQLEADLGQRVVSMAA